MQQAVETKPSRSSGTEGGGAVAQLEAEIAQRIKQLARTVKMQGFRPGKVPLKMVERHYGFQVRQEALSESVQRLFAEAVRSQNFRVAGMPRFEPVQGGADATAFEFQAVFEVYPEITMGELAGHKVTRPVTQVTEKDVDATIETLRRQRAKYERVTRGAASGDLVNIDFAGKVDGAPFEGGSGQNFTVVLGEGRMLPDFEAALLGLAEGQEKTFRSSSPRTTSSTSGQDAEFAGEGEPGRRAPASRGERGVRQDARRAGRRRLPHARRDPPEHRARGEEAHPGPGEGAGDGWPREVATFEVPRSLLDAETARMHDAAVADLKNRGMTTQNLELPADIFAERARHRVTLGLLVADIVRRNELAARADQVRKVIEEHADSFEQPAEMVRWFYGQPERMAEVEALVMEDNVVEWSLARMKVEDQPRLSKS